MNDIALELQNITREFKQAGETLQVLRGANLVLKRGEVVALVGPSGSGKTTLLQVTGLLDKPTSGKVILAGKPVDGSSDKIRTQRRLQDLGFVYQFHHLLPEFTAVENIVLPQMIKGVSKEAAAVKAAELLTALGLGHRLTHRPAQLSGGEQQRVAIARALANDPAVVLADEPTGNLDPHKADEVFDMFLRIAKERNVAAVIATHNMELAGRMDRIVTMQDGILVEHKGA